MRASMTKENKCEVCKKIFRLRQASQIGRFCSRVCQGIGQRRDQLKKYEQYLNDETDEQKLAWLKRNYEKFVVKNKNDCWDWNGSKSSGYGNFCYKGKIMKAHRASWILHNGPIPESKFVLHKCDVRHCSNPGHLFLGNQTDNMQDMASKGRTKVRCKLTIKKVLEIKNLLKLGVPMANLARKYNVSTNSIWEIKSGRSWKHAA